MESHFSKKRAEAILCRGLFCLQRFKVGLLFFWAMWMMNPARSAMAAQYSVGGGPFPTRNYNPVQLLFLSLPAEKATTLPRGFYEVKIEWVESNIILTESTSRVDALLKFETFRSSVHLKYGLTNRLEVGLEIPTLYRDGGFLDPLIISVEEAFSHLNPDRLTFSDGSFGGFVIKRDGKTIISGGNGQFGLGDIVLSGKYLALHEGPRQPALALRGALKLPTGDFDRAFGSGDPDVGIGLVLQKGLGSRWAFYLNQSVVFPTGNFGDTDVTLQPISTTAVAAEFLWTPRFSLVGQFDYYTTPFHGTGARLLDNGVTEGVLGFNYQIRPHVLWQLYGIENFTSPFPKGAAADFTLATSVAFRF